ncbi:MAG: phytochelatin synthase family protein [Alphaproteobacteria bacterium]
MTFIVKSSQKLFRFKFFGIFLFLFLNFSSAFALEIWNSEQGIAKFNSSQYKNDFFQLANFYQAQKNPLYCSSASALIVKNALFYPEIPSQNSSETIKPDGTKILFPLYISQDEF